MFLKYYFFLQMKTLNKFDISSFIAPMKAIITTHIYIYNTTSRNGIPQDSHRSHCCFGGKQRQCNNCSAFCSRGVTEIVCIIHITSVLCENPESKCEIARNYIGFSSLFQIFDNVTPTWKTDQPK